MMDANHFSTPVEQGALEAMTTNDEACDAGRYPEAVGSIMWMATMTRPDLAFAAAFLACFTSAPTNRHWGTAKRALRYIKGTMDHGICFRAQGPGKITAFCDAASAMKPTPQADRVRAAEKAGSASGPQGALGDPDEEKKENREQPTLLDP
ncbi:MAG: hypothetical protein BJ554DRAFT_4208 [Olpidium bornovanus]|uniref:Uncharacterized protein n=1 Tax=Olpidium bornovanus TaxID=278681 RepID=A0A8H7ZN37_9FUNG|nr:MAG: hypothetical protein BJ554DRAFT_4208 [Olpidium bornovanus]